jgi:hypothetical protein
MRQAIASRFLLSGGNIFFLKRRQKLCLNLSIKKERIVQLIYGKSGKNRYKHNTPAKATQQILATHLNYNPLHLNNSTEHLGETLQQKARGDTKGTRQTKPRGSDKKPRIINQVAADAFSTATFLLSLRLSDFSFRMLVRGPSPTFLIFPLIAVPVRRQAIDLPSPGIATSNLLSKSQISFAKRASELCGGGDGIDV